MKNFTFGGILILLMLFSCKKDTAETQTTRFKLASLKEAKVQMMTLLSNVVKVNPELKSTVETECLKQEHGDYEVRMDKLLEIDNSKHFLSREHRSNFEFLVSEFKRFNPKQHPIIFVPVMGKRDPNNVDRSKIMNLEKEITANSTNLHRATAEDGGPGGGGPVMVDQSGEGQGGGNNVPPCSAPYAYPGYVTNNAGYLEFYNCITEAYAWSYDVWVVGFEEVVSEGNNYANIEGYSSKSLNTSEIKANNSTFGGRNGSTEYGAIFQVTNLGSIEPWVRGKPEFKYFIHDGAGNLIKEVPIGRIKRSNLWNDAWITLYHFIGNWSIQNYGSVMYERWIEENNGDPVTVTSTNNNVTISTTIQADDKNLGLSAVSYYDTPLIYIVQPQLWTTYNLYNFNFRRTMYKP